MNTYGDMVTLLLTFFVLLFSFSTIDAQKWEEIVSSLSGTPFVAIKAIDPGDTRGDILKDELSQIPQPTPMPTPAPAEEQILNVDELKEKFDELYARIKEHIKENKLEFLLNVEKEEDAILIRMSDSALFDSGKDILKSDAKMILREICSIIEEYTELIRKIRVEGHTDDRPIRTAKFPDNWELSASRALVVVRYILNIMNIEPAKMMSVGYGEYQPVDTNKTAAGRAKNRRVDFVLESILIE